MIQSIQSPILSEQTEALRAGDMVLLSGVIYTARDAAHKRMCEMLARGEALPIDLNNATIYHVGPCPARPGSVIGPCGPTTSSRMDAYAPTLLDLGLKAVIGKGFRSPATIDAFVRNKAVYFVATGGAGALIAKCVKEYTPVAFEDLGTEALCRMVVEDFPLIVALDTLGNDIYQIGPEKYRK